MKHICFKVSYSKKIGTGHLIRCCALAKNLKKKNIISYLILNGEYFNKRDTKVYKNYFKKIIFTKHLINEINFLKKHKITTLVVDNPYFSLVSQKKIKNFLENLILFQDIPKKNYCDLIINYNYIKNVKKIYKSISYNYRTKYCLGPKYYIMNYNFNNNIKENKNEITVFLGGNAPKLLLEKILNILKNNCFKNIRVNIFLGKFMKNNSLSLKKENFNIYKDKNKNFFFKKIQKSIIFITSGGSTLIEGIFLNKICIAFSRAKNQVFNCENFKKKKFIFHFKEKFSSKFFKTTLLNILKNKQNNNDQIKKKLKEFTKQISKNSVEDKIMQTINS